MSRPVALSARRPAVFKLRGRALSAAQVREAVRILRSGGLLAFPTDTVYGLGADARHRGALRRLYALKRRDPGKPLAILVESRRKAERLARFDARARALARAFWPGGLTLVLPPTAAGRRLPRGPRGIGLRVPDHSGLRRVLKAAGTPLAATSANRTGSPECRSAGEVLKTFGDSIDGLLDGGRARGRPSTVADLAGPDAVVLRSGAVSDGRLRRALERA